MFLISILKVFGANKLRGLYKLENVTGYKTKMEFFKHGTNCGYR